jgi:hypothetical protein
VRRSGEADGKEDVHFKSPRNALDARADSRHRSVDNIQALRPHRQQQIDTVADLGEV